MSQPPGAYNARINPARAWSLQHYRSGQARKGSYRGLGLNELLGATSVVMRAQIIPNLQPGLTLQPLHVRPNRLNLLEVIDVVSSKVHRDVADGFYAAFSMYSEQIPFLRAERV